MCNGKEEERGGRVYEEDEHVGIQQEVVIIISQAITRRACIMEAGIDFCRVPTISDPNVPILGDGCPIKASA